MINQDILNKAIEIEAKEINKDIKRFGSGEIIYVPVKVETYDDGKIGCIDHTNIMRIYNDIIRGIVE